MEYLGSIILDVIYSNRHANTVTNYLYFEDATVLNIA